ncbi:MAG: phosphotransferase [Rickettsiales bacterium]|nr:phosphotransferase [Rickettsiales bacterium]
MAIFLNGTANLIIIYDYGMDTIINHISKEYNISNAKILKKLGGFSSDNYLVSLSKKKYVLKIVKNFDREKVNKLAELYDFLYGKDSYLSLPIKNFRGNFYSVVDESSIFLFNFVDGFILHEQNFNIRNYNSVAKHLKKFCQLNNGENNIGLINSWDQIQTIDEITARANTFLSNNKCLDPTVINSIREKIEFLEKNIDLILAKNFLKDKKYLVHGDFHNENILFTWSNKTYFLDFEETHLGHYVEDVVNFMFFACCNGGFEVNNLKRSGLFLREISKYLYLDKDLVRIGVIGHLYKMCSSFFLENKFFETKDKLFSTLLERDLKKIIYFRSNFNDFINHIMEYV